MLLYMHRNRILAAIDGALTLDQQSIITAVLVMYDHGLLRMDFNECGELLYSLRDNVTDRQWETALREWKQLDPWAHTYDLWRDAQ